MNRDNSTHKNPELLGGLFKSLPSIEDKEKFLEALSIVTEPLSKRILQEAASEHSPVTIDKFEDINETTMVRYLHLLSQVGLLSPIWDDNRRKFAITESGRDVVSLLEKGNQ
jgi:predicted transcriptional regulator